MLLRFYTKHDPAKVDKVDDFLAKYPSDVLVQKLSTKYGESPLELPDAEASFSPASLVAAVAKGAVAKIKGTGCRFSSKYIHTSILILQKAKVLEYHQSINISAVSTPIFSPNI